jgi:hypothetical protein
MYKLTGFRETITGKGVKYFIELDDAEWIKVSKETFLSLRLYVDTVRKETALLEEMGLD